MAGDGTLNQNDKQSEELTALPEEFDLVIINMDKVLFEEKAKSLIVPVPIGNLAILPGHTPIYTKLSKGKMTINKKSGEQEIEIDGGILKATPGKVTVLIGF